MSRIIDVAEIHGHESRALCDRKVERRQNALHAIGVQNLAVIRLPICGSPPADFSLRSGEEKRGRELSALFCRDPDGFPEPPSAVSNFLAVAHHENRIEAAV